MKAILRFKKMQTLGNVSGMEKHVERKMNVPNADVTKIKENISFIKGSSVVNLHNRLEEIKEGGGIVQKNSVVAIDCLMTASPEFWKNPKVEKEFIEKSHQYLTETFGRENIMSMVLHKDETSPHIHAIVCPAYESKDRWGNKKTRVGAKKWLDGRKKLSEHQDRFAEIMEPLGLERGNRKSKSNHKTIQEFYAELEKDKKAFKAILRDFPKKGIMESQETYMGSVEAHLKQFPDVKKVLEERELDKKKLIKSILNSINKHNIKKGIDEGFKLTNRGLEAYKPSVLKSKKEASIQKQKDVKEKHQEDYRNVIFKELLSEKPAKQVDWNFIKDSFNKLNQDGKSFVIRNIIKDTGEMEQAKKNAFFIITKTLEEKKNIEREIRKSQPIKSGIRDFRKSNSNDKNQSRGM